MKNLFSRIAVCLTALMLTFQFTSCQKESLVDDVSNSNQDLLVEVQTATNTFVENQQSISSPDFKKPKWLKIVIADLGGALEELINGGDRESIIIKGALASIKSSGLSGLRGNPSGTQVELNFENSQDFIGEQHYRIISLVSKNPEEVFDGQDFNYENYLNFVFDHLGLGIDECNVSREKCDCMISSGLLDYVLSDDYSIVSHLNDIEMLDDVRDLLVEYLTALEGTINTDDFIQYSLVFEASIIGSDLSSDSKAILLSNMSTARHGVAYWN